MAPDNDQRIANEATLVLLARIAEAERKVERLRYESQCAEDHRLAEVGQVFDSIVNVVEKAIEEERLLGVQPLYLSGMDAAVEIIRANRP